MWQRLLEILIGAAIGLAAAWFVLPIRSTDVLRRRIADALSTMSEALDPQTAERRPDRIVAAIRRVEQLRPSFHARQLVLRRWQPQQPVDWIDALSACEAPVVALVERGQTPGIVRKAVGAARKAMREPAQIEPARCGAVTAQNAGQATARPARYNTSGAPMKPIRSAVLMTQLRLKGQHLVFMGFERRVDSWNGLVDFRECAAAGAGG